MNSRSSASVKLRSVATGLLVVAASGAVARLTSADQVTTCKSVSAVVSVGWDRERAEKVSGVVARLQYPTSLELPSDPNDGSAKERVELLTGTSGGLFDALKKDTNADGADDLLSIGLITTGIGAGPFARVRFDCRSGVAAPAAAAFTCVADVADSSGSVPATCSATITSE